MAVPALLEAAWQFPPTRALMIRGGTAIAGGLAGKLIGSPETEQYRKQLKEQMDLLQKQMAGLPTPASKAVQQTIRQQSRQAQQSLATSAQGAGQTGTSVARGIQARQLGREAEQQATAQGQLSVAAQQQYTQLLGAQEAMAREERGHIQGILSYIMQGVGDAEVRELLMEVLRGNQRSSGSALPPSPSFQGGGIDLSPEGLPPIGLEQGLSEAGTLPSQTLGAPAITQLAPPARTRELPAVTTTAIAPEQITTQLPTGVPTFERLGLEQFPRVTTELTPTTFEPRETLGPPPPIQGPQPALGPPRELAAQQTTSSIERLSTSQANELRSMMVALFDNFKNNLIGNDLLPANLDIIANKYGVDIGDVYAIWNSMAHEVERRYQ